MNGKRIGIVLAALATLALTASLALARQGGGPGAGYGMMGDGSGYGMMGDGFGYGHNRIAQLSPEKQAAFQKLHDAYAAKTAQVRATLGVKLAELNAATVAPTPDQAKIDSLTKEIGELQGKLLSERTQLRIQVAKEVGPGLMGGFGRGYHHGGGYGPCGQGW